MMAGCGTSVPKIVNIARTCTKDSHNEMLCNSLHPSNQVGTRFSPDHTMGV